MIETSGEYRTLAVNSLYQRYLHRDADPNQRFNIYYTGLPVTTRLQLHAMAVALASCHGASACWAAGEPH